MSTHWNPVGAPADITAQASTVIKSTPQESIAGLRGTRDFGPNERPENFRETILWLDPNGQAPLTALMAKMGNEKTTDPSFHWFEEKQKLIRPGARAEATAVATSILLKPGADLLSGSEAIVPGDILVVELTDIMPGDGEQVMVTAVAHNATTGGTLTVERGFAGSTAAVIPINTRLSKIGSAFAEGTGAPDSALRNPAELENYVQIFKTTVDITETARKTDFRTGDPEKNDKKRKMFDHANSLEMAYWFGRKSLSYGANGKPKRTTAGLSRFIQTNRTLWNDSDNQLTEDAFISFVAEIFNWDAQGAGDERICFAGNQALTTLNMLARDSSSTRINFDGIVKTYGMNLARWILPQGTLYVRTHPLFNIHEEYSGLMAGINPRGIKDRALRATHYKPNVQENDSDSFKGQWLTESGLEVNHESTMFMCGGMFPANIG